MFTMEKGESLSCIQSRIILSLNGQAVESHGANTHHYQWAGEILSAGATTL
jgi:hypothetical protein